MEHAQKHIAEGCRWCVDPDLEKFFDRVSHDKLLAKIDGKPEAIHHDAAQSQGERAEECAVARPWETKFPGFSFTAGKQPKRRIAPRSIQEGAGSEKYKLCLGTSTAELLRLAGWLHGQQVSHVAMEATGVNWKAVRHMLEGQFDLPLANPIRPPAAA